MHRALQFFFSHFVFLVLEITSYQFMEILLVCLKIGYGLLQKYKSLLFHSFIHCIYFGFGIFQWQILLPKFGHCAFSSSGARCSGFVPRSLGYLVEVEYTCVFAIHFQTLLLGSCPCVRNQQQDMKLPIPPHSFP